MLKTKRYKHTVLKMSTTSTCRVCWKVEESIGHIMSACRPHMWSLYKETHNRVMYQVMLALVK